MVYATAAATSPAFWSPQGEISMSTIRALVVVLGLSLFCAAPGLSQTKAPTSATSGAHQAHEAYVEAINSNDLGTLLDMLTDDVVFMGPNDKPVVGKDAVRPWLEGYLAAYKTHWDKTQEEFTVINDDWAFERYSYKSTDTPVEGGDPFHDTGWGFVLYHHDADGKWRVARDAWGQDHPIGD